jgi:hypothetical protein
MDVLDLLFEDSSVQIMDVLDLLRQAILKREWERVKRGD